MMGAPTILQLGGDDSKPVEAPLREQILKGLTAEKPLAAGSKYEHTRSLPTVLCYDDRGLDIYEEITKLKEYYLFNAELSLLVKYGDEIARTMLPPCKEPQQNGTEQNGTGEQPLEEDVSYDPLRNSFNDTSSSRWGDYDSGVHNYGVNGHVSQHRRSASNGVVIELGAAVSTKTKVLLRSLYKLLDSKSVDNLSYWAVDLEHGQLVTTLTSLAESEHDSVNTRAGHGKVHIRGVRASYEEVFPVLGNGGLHGDEEEGDVKASHTPSPQSILWMGSSIGNFSRDEGAAFLKRIADEALQPGDTILLGIDGCNDKTKIELAYNDPAGVTRDFILNGVQRAANELGTNAFGRQDFDYLSHFNERIGAHEAFVQAKRDIELPTSVTGGQLISIAKGEVIAIEKSYKFNQVERDELFRTAGLRVIRQWEDEHGYSLFVLERPAFRFETTLSQKHPFGLPSLDQWNMLWKAFDTITLQMVTRDLLHTKPIDLRHICLFYVGHIPAFLDIHLSRFLKEPYTEPAHYPEIFERGIDPNVDNPSQIHPHSEVPEKEEDWPTLAQILDYRNRVRARLIQVYQQQALVKPSRRLARTLSMVYEHEALHAETLCYMLAQVADRIQSPPGFAQPDWVGLKRQWDAQITTDGHAARCEILSFPESTIVLGQDDVDGDDHVVAYDPGHSYGWDNETPARTVKVPAFRVSLLPISNLEYLIFLKSRSEGERGALVPSSWIKNKDGSFDIRVLPAPGRVAFTVGQHWPVQAGGEQLAAYAESKGGRLPTEGELRRFYEDHPVDGTGRNVGFVNWHPLPPSLPQKRRDGTSTGASNGGVFEWTSTDFAAHDGFQPSALYPLYSQDFFDGHHAKVLGGSYLTIPRIAGRPSFVNFYQRRYPYTFAGGRVVYPDL